MTAPERDPEPIQVLVAIRSQTRRQVLLGALESRAEVSVVDLVDGIAGLAGWYGRTDIDCFLVDWDALGDDPQAALTALPAGVVDRLLVLLPRDRVAEGPPPGLEDASYMTRPDSPLEAADITKQLVNNMLADYVIRHGTTPGTRTVRSAAPATRASRESTDDRAVEAVLARVVLLVLGEGADAWADGFGFRIGGDRSRAFVLVAAMGTSQRDRLVGRWIFDRGITLIPASGNCKLGFGHVFVVDLDRGTSLQRDPDARGLRFAPGPEAAEAQASKFDRLASSMARLLRANLSIVVAGRVDPGIVLTGLMAARRAGARVFAPPWNEIRDAGLDALRDKGLIDVEFPVGRLEFLFG